MESRFGFSIVLILCSIRRRVASYGKKVAAAGNAGVYYIRKYIRV